MADNTYSIKDLFTNMIRYVENQFAVMRNDNSQKLSELRKLRKIDRTYVNDRFKLITTNLKAKSLVHTTTEQKINVGAINKKSVKPFSVIVNYPAKDYKAIGVVGYSFNNAYIYVSSIYTGASSNKGKVSQVKLSMALGNISNEDLSDLKVTVKILWTLNGAIPSPIKTVDLNKGYEEK